MSTKTREELRDEYQKRLRLALPVNPYDGNGMTDARYLADEVASCLAELADQRQPVVEEPDIVSRMPSPGQNFLAFIPLTGEWQERRMERYCSVGFDDDHGFEHRRDEYGTGWKESPRPDDHEDLDDEPAPVEATPPGECVTTELCELLDAINAGDSEREAHFEAAKADQLEAVRCAREADARTIAELRHTMKLQRARWEQERRENGHLSQQVERLTGERDANATAARELAELVPDLNALAKAVGGPNAKGETTMRHAARECGELRELRELVKADHGMTKAHHVCRNLRAGEMCPDCVKVWRLLGLDAGVG